MIIPPNCRLAACVNQNAGANTSREGLGLRVAQVLCEPDAIFVTKELPELEPAIDQIIRGKYDVLVVSGGDGTLQKTSTVLIDRLRAIAPLQKPPAILLTPMGTMRIIGTNLKLTRMDPLALARHMRDKIRSGTCDSIELSLLDVNGDLGGLYGSGLAVNMLKRYYLKEQRGAWRVLEVMNDAFLDELASALTFTESRRILTEPVEATIELPGHDPIVVPHFEHTTLMCAAVPEVGLGCKGMPDAMSKPGHFMLRSSRMNYWEYLATGPMFWLGMKPPKTFDAVVREAVIRYAKPTIATLDGEMRDASMVDVIKSGPPIQFLVP